MSKKEKCLDNLVIENFFEKIKNKMFYGHESEFKTLDQFKKAMKEYIKYYNEQSKKVKLKGLTSLQVRNQALYLT